MNMNKELTPLGQAMKLREARLWNLKAFFGLSILILIFSVVWFIGQNSVIVESRLIDRVNQAKKADTSEALFEYLRSAALWRADLNLQYLMGYQDLTKPAGLIDQAGRLNEGAQSPSA